MILTEGSFLLLSLIGGGVALLVLIQREKKRVRSLREFFAAFSHELKTPIASLRLQVESLMESRGRVGSFSQDLLDRLFRDSVRLELQLENALALGEMEQSRIFTESLRLSEFLERARLFWNGIEIEDQSDDMRLDADRRALERIVNNLVQNAMVHGKAKKITFKGISENELEVSDDGLGFRGELTKVGKLFYRQNQTSKSGIGTYLIKQMMHKMNGAADFYVRGPDNELVCLLKFQRSGEKRS